MGNGVSTLIPCLKPGKQLKIDEPDFLFAQSEPLDELGHSFCYVRSSNRFISPTPSDRFLSPSTSLRFSPSHELARTRPEPTCFKSISGASVSANTATPRTVRNFDNIYDDATESTIGGGPGFGVKSSILNAGGFESTSSFCALPLQPVPRGATGSEPSGPMERSGLFMSGPIERGPMSGPLDGPAGAESGGGVPFSAPLAGLHTKKKKKKRKKSISGIRWYPNLKERKQRPWVVPVLNFGRRENSAGSAAAPEEAARSESDLQWALGKAGEDRVHVVVSEEQGWFYVGIYDGFNGPDAPEFLMGNLYRAVYSELQGLFWEVDEHVEETSSQNLTSAVSREGCSLASGVVEVGQNSKDDKTVSKSDPLMENVKNDEQLVYENVVDVPGQEKTKKVTFESGRTEIRTRKQLWEFLAEKDPEDGLDLSGSDRFAFSVDDAISVAKSGSATSRRWQLGSKLKQGLSKHRDGSHTHSKKLFSWGLGSEEKEKPEVENRTEETAATSGKKGKVGPIDHELVLRAMSRALEVTELAYLDMTDKVLDANPELALMGSCLLVVLMRDEDVYVMNVGDSRAIVAHYEVEEQGSRTERGRQRSNGSSMEGIIEVPVVSETESQPKSEAPFQPMRLTALQLSTDHSTSIEDEITRIKSEHPDDNQCIVNDRVKGRLKVTRAFGAGFLKQPKMNDALLEMFRNEFIGTAPYISCLPSLRHHRICSRDQFLVLSSDGLYQYLSNQDVVSFVENFMEKFPDGDPAQHLIEELLVRAAKKAGMEFHELLDIPQGDRRKYHDDVTVMVISLEGRIWKSSGKFS